MNQSLFWTNRLVNIAPVLVADSRPGPAQVAWLLLLLVGAAPVYGGALRADATFTSTFDVPVSSVAFDVPAQPLIDTPGVGDDDDLWLRFADGVYLDIGAEWVINSSLGSLMQFDENIPHLMVDEPYEPTDAGGTPVGGTGPYNNSIVGPTSALFINALGVGTAPTPGGQVYGVLLHDVFEGAAPRPTQVLMPTSRFDIFTPGVSAIVAHQVPEPGSYSVVCLTFASIFFARRR